MGPKTFSNSTKSKKVTHTVTMQEFLKIKMTGKVILSVLLPPLCKRNQFISFKIMPRSQNAHAIVNAGYLFKMSSNNCDIVEKCRIVYGGLSSTFIHAYATEEYLSGKNLFTNNTLQSALKVLEDEVVVEENPPEPSVKFRKQLALSLFYKALLTICPTYKIEPSFRSGSTKIHETRLVSKACQIVDTDPSLWPLNQPIPKLEAFIQCSGEAEYVDDMPDLHDEVFAAYVLSTVPQGEIDYIDPKPALVEGAFMMGVGAWTCERLLYSPQGELLTDRTWNYPIPLARDIPQDFRVYFRKNSYSTQSLFGAKATGEPPICLSVVIALALREAISSARRDTGIPSTEWFNIDGPFTVEAIGLSVNNKKEDFKFDIYK